MNLLIPSGYGLSECSPAVMYQHPDDGSFVGTVGKLFSGTYDKSFITNSRIYHGYDY
jgi:long-subunit acyl-CoA synthetase (AMP-forming)